MSDRRSLIHGALIRRRWVVNTVAVLVMLVPIPMWVSRHQDTQDRRDRDPVTVEVTQVIEQGNDDLVSAFHQDERIDVQYPGEVSVGDEIEVYFDGSQWHAMEQAPLWVPVAATALLWTASGVVIHFYPRMSRRRGWTKPEPVPAPGPIT